MVGGGGDAFIGHVHRMAAALDGQIELVAGAFSSQAEKSRQMGQQLYLESNRVYGSFEEMIDQEQNLPASERIELVSIVTPNHLHYSPAKKALECGFHVICEKPLGFSVQEANNLCDLVEKSGLVFGVMHNYTGYPMVKEARYLVKSGLLGAIRKVVVEYPQGWLASRIESDGQKQASWRTDPKRAGTSCCVGDIGTHAENLAEYITGLAIQELSADVSTFVEGRLLDDDANVLLRFQNGAKGILFASQIAAGEENELKIRVYGEKGGLEWLQSDPNSLMIRLTGESMQVRRAGVDKMYLSEHALAHCRLPGGHPEGYLESMANIYRNIAMAIRARKNGVSFDKQKYDFPTVMDGLRGMRFIEAVITSGSQNAQWINLA